MTQILIVEDSRTQAEALRFALESEGFQVLHAPDGLQALALLQSAHADVILSDVHMPHISGFELCARLKNARYSRP